MFHPDTQFLIEHWRGLARRSNSRAGIPDRTALHPDVFGVRLPRMFMLDVTESQPLLRVAGGWIEAFHDQSLKDAPFSQLWRPRSADLALAAVHQSVREGRPVALIASAGARSTAIDLTLAPLRGASGLVDRVLGLYAPTATLVFGKDERRLLNARMALGIGVPARASLSLAAVHGQRVA